MQQLVDMVEAFGTPRIALAGDFMLDCYLYGEVERISPEAPIPVMRVTDRKQRPAGAVENLTAPRCGHHVPVEAPFVVAAHAIKCGLFRLARLFQVLHRVSGPFGARCLLSPLPPSADHLKGRRRSRQGRASRRAMRRARRRQRR